MKEILQAPIFIGCAVLTVIFFASVEKFSGVLPAIAPLSSVHHSDTIEGYVEQAKTAYSKSDYDSSMDAWQKAVDRAKSLNAKPVTIGMLYMQAGDLFGDINDYLDFSSFINNRFQITHQGQIAAEVYWTKAAKTFHDANLSFKELQARQRLALLMEDHLNVDKKANLEAILALTKGDKEPNPIIVPANYDLGRLAFADGDLNTAAKYFSTGLRAHRDENKQVPIDVIRKVSNCLRAQSKNSELIHLLKDVLHEHPAVPFGSEPALECLNQLKMTYQNSGDPKSVDAVQSEIDRIKRTMR